MIDGFDYYLGATASTRTNYQVGGGKYEENTGWTRWGGTAAFGYQFDANNRIDMTVRTDGIYDAGFRGSSANIFAFDTRYNRSVDMSYNGKIGDRGNIFWQGYYVQDVDDLNNPSPLSALNAVTARTTVDHNRRSLDIVGSRFQPSYNVWEGNQLSRRRLGAELDTVGPSRRRRRRTQLSPQDNNETNTVGVLPRTRRLLRRLSWCAAACARPTARPRWAHARHHAQPGSAIHGHHLLGGRHPPSPTGERPGGVSGFRADRDRARLQLHGDTDRHAIFGNRPVAGDDRQIEAGHLQLAGWALRCGGVQNIIANRIAPITSLRRRDRQLRSTTGRYRGARRQFQAETDMIRPQISAGIPGTGRSSAGCYNFKMIIMAPARTATGTRINQYGMDIGLFGQSSELPWSFSCWESCAGEWYNPREPVAGFFPGQILNDRLSEGPFWIWKRAEVSSEGSRSSPP